ncbi:MAG: L,D-transpeptidase family protein [Bacteroidota bacterium]
MQYGIEPEDENHIHSFYKNRYFESAWFKIDGQLNDNALALINYAQNHEYANQLISKDLDNLLYEYTKQQPSHLLNKTSLLGAIEIRLSKLFLKTAIVNLNGLVKPEDIAGIAWNITPRYVNLPQMMDKALHLENISGELNGLLPQNKAYYTLKEYLKTYKYIATQGGWPTVPETAIKLELGDTSEVVKVLKARLIITQDLDAIHFNGLVYNDAVLEGVKHFQQRHGLHTDGVIGKNTLQNLNISVEERIRQIQLNLERFKWLPDLSNRGDKYIWVNIPHYKLKLFNQGQLLTEQNVVTGAKRSQTPCFDSYITDIVINPYWNVPYSIAKDEIAPKVSEDTQYLLEKNYEVINGWGTNRVMDSVGHLDWKDKSLHRNYRFRQKPGPGNALGVLKFNLPNPWSIYLHDTPSKSTFLREKRAYSHGCIRVQNPDQLATLLFNGQQGLDEEKLSEKINSRKTQTILLKDHVNVFIVYMTSGIDENGKLQLFEDVYGRDAKIDERLRSLLM